MYYNPVKVFETNDWLTVLKKNIDDLNIKKPLIVTSQGNLKRNNLEEIFPNYTFFSDIENNPTFLSCQRALDFVKDIEYDGLIAIGGGSVMDTSKAIMAAIGNSIYSATDLLSKELKFLHRIPALFIPTTHGTASEVTMWGTIWNMDEKRKYSLSYEALYPDVAILDGSLTTSLPMDLSVTTIMDAVSHSFEAIWNKNANPISTDFAIEAICILLTEAYRLKCEPDNVDIRNRLLKASNLAGLAFSNTKTAAAHSMSYPLTISYDIPHGIACSIPIVPLLRLNEPAIQMELERIYNRLHLRDLSELEVLILQIPEGVIDFSLVEWGVKQSDIEDIVTHSFTKSRMGNNIVDLSSDDIKSVFEELLKI